jgi:perosamine synthetase
MQKNPVKGVMKMNIPLAKPIFDEEMKIAAINALQNDKFVMGESVFKFEEEFARYCRVKHAVSTSSGTFALQLALQALGVSHGDNVVTTPYSFIATANAAYFAGAEPVFADIDVKTYNINPSLVEQKLTDETKAILPVHLYGYPAEMNCILDIAEENNCGVVEDCCQAHGAIYHGKRVGSIADVGCFSFYPSKNMTVCGDGGMAITNNKDLANKIAKLRDCGRKSHYEHDLMGYTARLNTVNAAIGRVQLKRIDEWNEKRRNVAMLYNKLLGDIEGLELPPAGNGNILPVYHLYVVKTNYRNELKTYLESNGIQCGIHYPLPIHLQPIYKELYGYKEGEFPVSERVCNQVLSLPMYPDLEEAGVEQVAMKIHEFFAK